MASSHGVPSATHLLAETVREYRRAFPGIARAFLPVFAIFAGGQIGLGFESELQTVSGLVALGLALACVGVVELVAQVIATGGVMAVRADLPTATIPSVYRAGGRAFWPMTWTSILVALALAAAPVVAFLVTPVVVKIAASVVTLASGESVGAAILAAVIAVTLTTLAGLALAAVTVLRLAFAVPLAARGRARGLAALERSASLSLGRSWVVAGRLGAGLLAVGLVMAPFVMLLVGTGADFGTTLNLGEPWSWTLLTAAYFLAAVPFGALYLCRLADSLADTEAERAVARVPRRWVRGLVWGGAAALAIAVIF
jgi:hypothetical protein